MPALINWKLVKSPVNWITVILMLAIAGFAVDILLPKIFPTKA